MPRVEPADHPAATPAGGRSPAGVSPAPEVFASLLASVRTSSSGASGSAAGRAREAGAASRRHEYLSDALWQSGRQTVDRPEHRSPERAEPQRGDDRRAAQRAERSGRSDLSDRQSALREKAVRKDAPPEPDGVHPGAEPDTSDPQTAPTESIREETPQQSGESPTLVVETTEQGPSLDDTSPLPGSGECVGAPPVAPLADTGAAAPGGAPSAPADSSGRAGAAPIAPNRAPAGSWSQPPDQETRQGSLPEGAASLNLKGGEASSRSSDAPADFQNVLHAAGNGRTRAAEAGSRASPALAGKPTAAGGVNLSEARAVNELADVVRANIGGRHSVMILRLDPPDLGQLRIDVRMHDQTLALRFEAQTAAGQEALQSRLSELRAALEQHGIQVQQVDVELRPPPPDPAPDAHSPTPQSTSQWGEYSGGQGGGQTGDADARQSLGGFSDPQTAAGGVDGVLDSQGHGDVGVPAEPGIDLIV